MQKWKLSSFAMALAFTLGSAFGARALAEAPKGAAPVSEVAVDARKLPKELREAGITEHLGDKIAVADLTFTDEEGQQAPLSKFFPAGSTKPVVLSLVYYECPNLCNFLLNGFVQTLREMDGVPGDKYDLVTVSIEPKEGPALAKLKKAAYLNLLGKPGAEKGWHFLTGTKENIDKLAAAVGFGFKWDAQSNQYAHSSALFVLSPEAMISRYLYGVQFKVKDVKLALLEASNGKMGTALEKFLLFCYRYDPSTRGYSLVASRLVQSSSLGMILVFGGYLAVFWRRQRKENT